MISLDTTEETSLVDEDSSYVGEESSEPTRRTLQKDTKDISIIIYGKERVGKSTLGNLLLDRQEDLFDTGVSFEPITLKTSIKVASARGYTLTIADTPGLNSDLAQTKKSFQRLAFHFPFGLDCILLAMSPKTGLESSSDLLDMLLGASNFNKNFWEHVIFVFTHVPRNERKQIKKEVLRSDIRKSQSSQIFREVLGRCENRFICTDNEKEDKERLLEKIQKLRRANYFNKLKNAYGKTSLVNRTKNYIHVGLCQVGPLTWVNGLPPGCNWESGIVPGLYTIKILSAGRDEGFTKIGRIVKPVLFGVAVASLPVTVAVLPEILTAAGAAVLFEVALLRGLAPVSVAVAEAFLAISGSTVDTENSSVGWNLGVRDRQLEIYGGEKDTCKSGYQNGCLSFEPFMVAEVFEENGKLVRKFHKMKRAITKAMQYLVRRRLNTTVKLECTGCYTRQWADAVREWKNSNGFPDDPVIDKEVLKRFFETKVFFPNEHSDLVPAIIILLNDKYPAYGSSITWSNYYMENRRYGSHTQEALNRFIRDVPELMFQSGNEWDLGIFDVNILAYDTVNEFVWAALFGDCDPWYEEI